jgi:hypothetical protein
MLTQERVKELFRYEDGNLIRKVRTNSRGNIGDVAGCVSGFGYLKTMVDGKYYFNHRLVFLFHYGYMPENMVDHIDRCKTNNRIDNLREASQSCNIRNAKQPRNNTSGVKGIHWFKQHQKWAAYIDVGGSQKHLGIFIDFTEAVAHRLAAEQCLNWSDCDSNSPAYQYMKDKK